MDINGIYKKINPFTFMQSPGWLSTREYLMCLKKEGSELVSFKTQDPQKEQTYELSTFCKTNSLGKK